MNTPNCLIIHGCPSDPDDLSYTQHRIPRTQQQLIAHGIPTQTPLMPAPWKPDYQVFKQAFEHYQINEHSILIGHSCGCAFLVRRLSETKQSVAKLILVAPWKIAEHENEKDFYDYLIDPTLSKRIDEIIIFTSDDEEDEGKQSLTLFHESLGGTIINLPDHGHYTRDDMGTQDFPELVEAVCES